MNSKPIPIFYACDGNFVKYTMVSLASMMENASKDRIYNIHVLHTDIPEEMKSKMLEMENEQFKISFVNVMSYLERLSSKLPIRHYYTKTTYYRLFIAEMFPEYEKAVYIDSDTVVLGDISRLYDTDLSDNYVAACHEQVMKQMDVYGTYVEEVLDISRHSFFNAGLIVINCDMWRKCELLSKFSALLSEYNFIVTQDEDYLNVLCKDRVFWLDGRWNTELTEGIEHSYAPEDAYILHYIMTNKPWHYKNCRGSDIFYGYVGKTPVKAEIYEELEAYTDEQKEKDRLSCDNLMEMAIQEIGREDNFKKQRDIFKDPSRLSVLNKIKELEKNGQFDVDAEDDPPSRELLPKEIDYLRTKLTSKIKAHFAYKKAKKFLNAIIKNKQMIIKDIKGLENLESLKTGAVITCNHFNPFDTFAMHEAFIRSGQDKKRKLYRVIREGNYTSFPGFYGYLMRNFYTLPLSSNKETMHNFGKATDKLLRDGNFVLVYPEQSLWYNYRKPKPLKSGAYSIAVRSEVPVLPCFITMRDSDIIGADGFPIQEYTINIGKPIYPDNSLKRGERIEALMSENYAVWKDIYKDFYGTEPIYATV